MRLVAVDEEEGEALPLEYDPVLIEEYWGRRPVAVATRVMQLLGISSGARRCCRQCDAAGRGGNAAGRLLRLMRRCAAGVAVQQRWSDFLDSLPPQRAGFLGSLVGDWIGGRLGDPSQEVQRAIQLRDIMTSLGPGE